MSMSITPSADDRNPQPTDAELDRAQKKSAKKAAKQAAKDQANRQRQLGARRRK
jgi:hypothetical protein